MPTAPSTASTAAHPRAWLLTILRNTHRNRARTPDPGTCCTATSLRPGSSRPAAVIPAARRTSWSTPSSRPSSPTRSPRCPPCTVPVVVRARRPRRPHLRRGGTRPRCPTRHGDEPAAPCPSPSSAPAWWPPGSSLTGADRDHDVVVRDGTLLPHIPGAAALPRRRGRRPHRRPVAEHLEECRRCGLQARTYQAIKEALRSGYRDVDDLALRRLHASNRSSWPTPTIPTESVDHRHALTMDHHHGAPAPKNCSSMTALADPDQGGGTVRHGQRMLDVAAGRGVSRSFCWRVVTVDVV